MKTDNVIKRLSEISVYISEYDEQMQKIFALCYLHGRQDFAAELKADAELAAEKAMPKLNEKFNEIDNEK